MRQSRAEIELKSLRDNYEGIRKRVGDAVRIMGVVKANAYGHGIVEIARALESFGADYLGVGFLEEGVELRQNGIHVPILVLGGVMGSQIHEFLRHRLEFTIASLQIAQYVNEVASSIGRKAPVHLKIDTGMERIGVRSPGAPAFIEAVCRMKQLEVVGLYSHLATSGTRDRTFVLEQLERFHDVLRKVSSAGIEIPYVHIANSGAILDLPESHFTMVRPGLMLYGAYPTRETSESIPLQPVMQLKSRIVYLKTVPAATSISYGRQYFTRAATSIATVPIGYGDGYSRRLSGQAEVLINGRRYPVAGTICMDQLMVDLGTGSGCRIGDDVTLLGRDGAEEISAWELADRSGTIPYEIFTAVTARVPRVYVH